jgi:hypothetical protein
MIRLEPRFCSLQISMPWIENPTLESTFSETLFFYVILNVLQNSEYILIKNQFAPNGFFDWGILKLRFGRFARVFNPIFNFVVVSPGFTICAVLSSVFAVSAFLLRGTELSSFLLGIVLLLNVIFSYRNFLSGDGSDHMGNILCVCLFVLSIKIGCTVIQNAAVTFICLQSILSYFTSGVAKLCSKPWRDGRAVLGLAVTDTYGNYTLARLLTAGRGPANLAVCWSVILFEMIFPIVLLIPFKWCIAMLCLGAIFHILNAWFIGLNRFVWAFLGTYPSILYIHSKIGVMIHL